MVIGVVALAAAGCGGTVTCEDPALCGQGGATETGGGGGSDEPVWGTVWRHQDAYTEYVDISLSSLKETCDYDFDDFDGPFSWCWSVVVRQQYKLVPGPIDLSDPTVEFVGVQQYEATKGCGGVAVPLDGDITIVEVTPSTVTVTISNVVQSDIYGVSWDWSHLSGTFTAETCW